MDQKKVLILLDPADVENMNAVRLAKFPNCSMSSALRMSLRLYARVIRANAEAQVNGALDVIEQRARQVNLPSDLHPLED